MHTKMETIVFFSILSFILGSDCRQLSRDTSVSGYLYDRPLEILEVPKQFKESEEEEGPTSENSTRHSTDEYLPPPKSDSVGSPHSKAEEHLRRGHDDKKDLHERRRKFAKEQQFYFADQKRGGPTPRNEFGYKDEKK